MATRLHDLYSNAISGTSLGQGALKTTTANGTGVDLLQSEGLVTVVVANGAITDGTHTLSVEESTDNSTYTAVTLNESLAALTSSTTAGTIQFANFQRTKRYVRAVTTVTGSPGTGGYYSATFLAEKKFIGS